MPAARDATVSAWSGMVRAARRLTDAVEAEVKQAGFPPLTWYDVLNELSRAPRGRLTPRELEDRTAMAQYNLSRLLDRLEREGLVQRIEFPGDRRRQRIEITGPGRFLRKAMWPVYGGAIERHLGSQLSDVETERLAVLLGKVLR
jgi:DNA-binding MarR family transcriptional regulator